MNMSIKILVCFMVLVGVFTPSVECKKLWDKDSLNIGYDFEQASDIDHINGIQNTLTRDNKIHKHGKFSLKWKWRINQPLHIDLTPQLKKFRSTKKRICGLHFWIHQTRSSTTHLRVTFLNKKDERLVFRVYLQFKNWRAVARTFAITNLRLFKNPTSVLLEVEDNDPFIKSGEINLDLIRISNRCVGWAYDYINTPQVAMPYGIVNEIGGAEDLNGIYDSRNFWQSMYKWRKIDVFENSKLESKTKLSKEENRLTKELNKIEKRIDNWYFSNEKHSDNLSPIGKLKLESLRHCNDNLNRIVPRPDWSVNLKHGNIAYKRLKAFASLDFHHQVCFDSAYEKLNDFIDDKEWPSLFPSRDVLPHSHKNWTGLKFNEVIGRIIFPLSLEYFISKRRSQRKNTLNKALQSEKSFLEIIKQELHKKVIKSARHKKDIFKTFKAIDNRKLRLIRKLFNYINSEGWDDGSGLGNTDHLINLNSGFVHSLYLLRKDLKNNKFFRNLINTARWYSEMGELHQKKYLHDGSTADKIRNLMLNRLLIMIASPYNTKKEARQKINDAKNLKRWIENSLKINQGYGGIIKPDFTGYHHKGVYMSAYIPPALHTLALSAYFLQGTSFAIDVKYLKHLKLALETIHIISNNNAVPVSVSGAKVAASTNIAVHTLPAFAYLAKAMSKNSVTLNPELATIFLKLYKPHDEFVKMDLIDGQLSSKGHQYFNSIGSIDILENIYKLAKTGPVTKITSPKGHWVFSYAGLNIHRRQDWTVSVKGFSKYIWDYESTVDQNVYGRYQSHGYLSIANGRESLESNDVFSGWDWNKIPGATTVDLDINQLQSADKCRYFSNNTMVGGLSFGRHKNKNGLFAMDFTQPKYIDKVFQNNRFEFSFKKSYLFVDDMIIALGSNIKKTGLQRESDVITTIFQNKFNTTASEITVNEKRYYDKNTMNENLDQYQPITLVDTNNNGYFIPVNNDNINLKIDKNDNTNLPNGLKVINHKTYGSVTINHGSEPLDNKYEYAILVNSGKDKIEDFKRRMTPWNFGTKPYYILQQDEVAHIVQIHRLKYKLTSYAIFDAEQFMGHEIEHVIHKVNRPCLIVVKETRNHIHISLSDPDLRMFDDYILYSKYVKEDLMYKAFSKADWLKITFNKYMKLISKKNSNSTLQESISPVYEKINQSGAFKPEVKMLMSHGLTTNLKFKRW